MIVWGGYNGTSALNDGARYNPSTNVWTVMSTTGAVAARYNHTAIWTGTEMMVWGGGNGSSYLPDGGRYHSAANTWAVAAPSCPLGIRSNHTAVWSGTEMLVWGGTNGTALSDGARYNPDVQHLGLDDLHRRAVGTVFAYCRLERDGDDRFWGLQRNELSGNWRALQPIDRYLDRIASFGCSRVALSPHRGVDRHPDDCVWRLQWCRLSQQRRALQSIHEYLVCNGCLRAPGLRSDHTAIWSGTQMIVFGGYNGTTFLNDGGRYNPVTDAWSSLSSTSAPAARADHTATWTGSDMIVWGGFGGTLNLSDGGHYNPTTDTCDCHRDQRGACCPELSHSGLDGH